MSISIDYYFSVASPWTYLGALRLEEIVREHRASVIARPVHLDQVFAATGGLNYPQRSPERRNYRQVDLARWSAYLGLPLRLEPRFYPVDRAPASRLILAAREAQLDALALSSAVLRACWAEDRNIADDKTLREILRENSLPVDELMLRAAADETDELLRKETENAIAAGVFGAPSYVVGGEIFWGQDRLHLLNLKLYSLQELRISHE